MKRSVTYFLLLIGCMLSISASQAPPATSAEASNPWQQRLEEQSERWEGFSERKKARKKRKFERRVERWKKRFERRAAREDGTQDAGMVRVGLAILLVGAIIVVLGLTGIGGILLTIGLIIFGVGAVLWLLGLLF